MRISRRLLLGTIFAGGAVAWAGASLARMARGPRAPRDFGRIRPFATLMPPARVEATLPFDASLAWLQQGGSINDASGLSRTPVFGVVQVRSRSDVAVALSFARDNRLKVAMAAVRHSMGGQAFDDGALVLDMRSFNAIEVDAAAMTVRVEPGATWHDIQNRLHPRFAVKAMQSTDIFSVGGSISVNAHGMDHQAGAVAGSIRSLEVMLADGSVRRCSANEDSDLFRHVVGGYGLFGVIVSAELEIVDNAVYRTSRALMAAADFPEYFAHSIAGDRGLGLFYGHLSTAPGSLLEEMVVYRYDLADARGPVVAPPLAAPGMVGVKRAILNLSKLGAPFRELKWLVEKRLEPEFEACTIERSAAMGEAEACFVSRNDPMHDSVPYLFNDMPGETDILHEYFFPRDAFVPFIAGAKTILARSPLPLLNASIRVVDADSIALPYAIEPAFSLVLYVNQRADSAGNEAMQMLTREMIDLTLKHRGRFFLPYQMHYTARQLLQSYPELPAFVAAKRALDPQELFTSTFWRGLAQTSATA